VLAQENLDLEGKNLLETSSKSLKTSRSVSPSPASAQIQSSEAAYVSDTEEFFDIEDDPLTDEEQENKSSDASLENRSVALRSCDESSETLNSKIETKSFNGVLASSSDKKLIQFKPEIFNDFDSVTGWR
jgi:hypothetical protein